jgi:iron complex outermembrane receptor protein
MAKSSVRAVVQGLLAAGACFTAQAVLAATPVASEVHTWNIPAEDGAAAVRDFGIQSGVAISAVQTDLQGMRLNAVTGSMSVDKALRMLVAGTGLKYVYDASGRAVTLTSASKPAAPKTTQTTVPASAKQDPPPADDSVLLEEIVVTARKREENLQDVPVSAQVISSQVLKDYNIRSLTELSQSLPGIQLNATSTGGQFFIRGIGSGTSFTFDQSVGTFIDDIFHGRTRIAEETFLDLDRIEVLKGPQSTYFGNNAVAGALNIVTAKPTTDSFEGSIRALYGQYGQYAGEGMLNIPLSSDLAVRIAAIGDGMSGWATDPYAGHNQPDVNNKAGRITFLYKPSDDFDATLKIEGGDNEESDGSVIADCPPPAPFGAVLASQQFCSAALKNHYPTGINLYEDTTDAGQGVDLSTFEDVLTMHYRVGEDTLTSVTGFYNYHYTANLDADGIPLQELTQQTKEFYHQFSQELRIASPQGQTLEWLGGLYFQNDHLTGIGGNLDDFFVTAAAVPKADAALLPYLPLGSYPPYNQAEHSYAAFGSLDWNVTDQFQVGAGLRGTWDYKTAGQTSLYGTATEVYGGVVPLPANLQALAQKLLGAQKPAWVASNSYNAAMPSVHIDYKIVPAVMVYATYAKGFLAGTPTDVGYVTPGVTPAIPTPPIKPERVNDYEVGLKSSLFEDHLRLNADVFRSNYTDLQISSSVIQTSTTTNGPQLVTYTDNAGSSRTEGVEFSGEWVQNGFRFKTDLTYLHAYYISYTGVALTAAQTYCSAAANKASAACVAEFPGGVGLVQNLSGQPTSFAPRWSASVTASYSFGLPGGYHLIPEADVNGTTNYFYALSGTDDPELVQAGYIRLDGRLSFVSPKENWGIDVILKNLTDKAIVAGGAGGTPLPLTNGSTLLQLDQPRNVAVQAHYQW